jgi:ABC-2 type transport system permease protein
MTGLGTVLRVETIKLAAQARVRVVALAVLLGPPVVALVLKAQTGLPTDTLYGRWVHEIGLALPLVLLGSAGLWGIPLLASLAAGDIFAAEDTHRTWSTLLTRSRSRLTVVTAKSIVAVLCTVGLVTILALSSLASGLLVTGTQPLVGLTGQPISLGSGIVLVLVSWASVLGPAIAVTALALLLSAWTRNGIVATAVPVAVVLGLFLVSQLAALGAPRPLLLAPGLQAWHTLLVDPAHVGPVLVSTAVALGWAALALGGLALVLRRQDLGDR